MIAGAQNTASAGMALAAHTMRPARQINCLDTVPDVIAITGKQAMQAVKR